METCCSRFTAAEGGARLAAVASVKNTIITEHCTFVATRLLHEDAYKIRGLLSEGRQRSVFLTRASRIAYVAYELGILTDLAIGQIGAYEDVVDWKMYLDEKEVIVCTSKILKCILENGHLAMDDINVLVIDSCHLISTDNDLKYVMHLYKQCTEINRPKLLALTYPIFTSVNNENEVIRDKEEIKKREDKSDVDQELEDSQSIPDSIENEEGNDKGILANEITTTDVEDIIESEGKQKHEASKILDDSDIDNTKIIEADEIDNCNTIDKGSKGADVIDNIIEELHSTDVIDKTITCINVTDANVEEECKDDVTKEECKDDVTKEECKDGVTKEECKDDVTKEECKDDVTTEECKDGVTKEECKDGVTKEECKDDITEEECKQKKEVEVTKDTEVNVSDSLGVYKNVDDFEMYEKLGWKIEELEDDLDCEMDLAEDIDAGKRLSATNCKPKELIIEYGKQISLDDLPEVYQDLDVFMRRTVQEGMDFINEHRYDPSEIYGEDLYEEFINIPDPTKEPKEIFNQFLYILNELGPYAADKAAFSLLSKLEKLKIKVPYERHFLLLCMCTTVLIKIRGYADYVFSKYNSDWEKIEIFCTPKVLRLAEILEQFRPPDTEKIETNSPDSPRNETDNSRNETDSTRNQTDSPRTETDSPRNESDCTTKETDSLRNETDSPRNETDCTKNENDCTKNEIDSPRNETGSPRTETDSPRIESDSPRIETNSPRNETDSPRTETDSPRIETDSPRNETDCTKNESDCKNEKTKTEEMLKIIENCDFSTLGDRIEDRVNTYESNLKEIDVYCENDCLVKNVNSWKRNVNEGYRVEEFKSVMGRGSRQRTRGRPRVLRNNSVRIQQNQQNPDALCGIMFLREPLMAKILFMLIVDISRCRSSLSYLCAQYCAVEATGKELQECQRQSRKQEDVLKKFRMHECNLLLATPALEEGIDLPRCNLVLRWDVPPSYRSHALCRGRARAPRSSLALLAEAPVYSKLLLHHLAIYRELDQIVTRKCGCGIQDEPTTDDENQADDYTAIIKAYSPIENKHTPTNTEVIEPPKNLELRTSSQQNASELKVEEKLEESIQDKDRKEIAINKDANITNGNEKSENVEIIDETKMINNYGNKVDCDDNSDVIKTDKKSFNLMDSDLSERTIKKSDSDSIASVDLSTAIALINRYCGKLPSDTFTRLAPQWWMEEVELPDRDGNMKKAYICTLRLPLNCPVKYNIVGHPMPTRVLARRMVALQACRILHKSGELDNQLMPIGKENFKAVELDGTGTINNCSNVNNGEPTDPNDSARPGTTKRRQYYFKRTAGAFTDCQPVVDSTDEEIEATEGSDTTKRQFKAGEKRNTLYAIDSRLWCALPERYNTRGRRLHAPQHARQAIGILMARHRADKLQIPAFPVYTRSGEVRVSVELAEDADVRLSPRRARLVRRFMRFVFSDVLRVRRRGMKLQSEGSTHNNYYIVPTVKTTNEDGSSKVDIDWSFLELIFKHTEEKRSLEVEKPILFQQDDEEEYDIEEKKVESKGKNKDGKVKKMNNPLLKDGETFCFDPEKYKEAVVTPWYRNQDQPQFFLVAEICWNLSPDSAFPSATHTTFREYYSTKYGVTLTQPGQPLLDVDHTSARLNLLTPRYVNRKGVALPVSSERTRRAKRDRLDQKQILVPELCRVHPFAAPLWFATVALPCVLYRINALLIADEIRRAVAIDVGLGIPKIDDSTCPGFQWPPLDFGWSLAEVLSADSDKMDKKKGDYDEEDSSERELKEMRAIEDKEEKQEELVEVKEKTINDILQEKEDAENGFEIGTWSNEMASCIPETVDYDEYLEPLPSNLTFCTSSGGANWTCPIEKPKHYGASRTFSVADSDCSYMSSDFDTDDSDVNSEGSDEETDASGFCSSKNSNAAMGVRIEYKTAHEAEAVDVERVRSGPPAPQPCAEDDAKDLMMHRDCLRSAQPPIQYIEKFRESVRQHEKDIIDNELLIKKEKSISDLLPDTSREIEKSKSLKSIEKIDISTIFPYSNDDIVIENGQVTIDSIERNKRRLLEVLKKTLPLEDIKKMNCFSMKDINIDSPDYVNEKLVNVGFDKEENYSDRISKWGQHEIRPYYQEVKAQDDKGFNFDFQPVLEGHPGPSPSVILQALTMSNANDGINLERLETIGDSFLKFAITAYLYCAHPTVHEGKLSHMRSKQVSNLNLYRLGRGKRLGARMTASKFEPHDNWLPPCHRAPPTLHHKVEGQEQCMEGAVDNAGCFIPYNLITQHSIPDKSIADCVEALIGAYLLECGPRGALLFMSWLGIKVLPRHDIPLPENHPYVVQHKGDCDTTPTAKEKSPTPPKRKQRTSESDSDWSDDDKEIEDGDQTQLELGPEDWSWPGRAVGSLKPYRRNGIWYQPIFGELRAPPSPLLRYIEDPEGELEQMLSGYEALERTLQYRFRDRSLLLQALTHASHQSNRLTDCYQRLEFLGDAILDYLITRHLYEDARRHSPGALTDLRSALVNNTIFATLAARHGFHKYFRHMSPGLNEVLTKYVKIQEENGHSISEEHYLIHEDEMEQAEDVEVPKALGDLFESVAGAIFLDSGMSLGAVWRSYVRLMGAELEAFSAAAPKSPVRELLEAEPDTAKFGKPERLADGRRVRVCVEVFGRGAFKGVGRNYRIAKGTAARCALRHLKIHRTR